MTVTQLLVFCSSFALVGMNLSIVTLMFKWRVRYPLVAKMVCVCGFLVYVGLSAYVGNPSAWRAALGLAISFADAIVLWWIVLAVRDERPLIPLKRKE